MLEHVPAWLGKALKNVRAGHGKLAIARLGGEGVLGKGGFTLTSPAFGDGEPLDPSFTADEEDAVAPPLEWTAPPAGAQELVLIVEDPDAPREKPFVHWMIWDIHAEVTALPEGLPNAEFLATPQGGIQGRNDMGGYGWFGPRPPAGHGMHRYYFQVFALDDFLAMGPDTPLADLLNALKGHTIAKGEMMATYEAPAAH